MLLADLVTTADAVAATTKRPEKGARLADLVSRAGAGPAGQSGSHRESGSCADLATAATGRSSVIVVPAPGPA